jgi:hypothetical protein
MVRALKAAWGWLVSAMTLLGIVFSFLFFGSSSSAQITIVWVYAIAFVLFSLVIWFVGALLEAIKATRQTFANIRGVFSNSGDPANDLNFLLDPNDSFSSLLKCSVFFLQDGVEFFIGSAFVNNVQEDRRVQLKVSSREQSKADIWDKIGKSDKTTIDKLLVKVGERMS